MMYLQTIVKRSDDELTKKIYDCQKKKSVKGDWIELVQKDFEKAGIEMNEAEIINETKGIYKARIKKNIKEVMLNELKTQQSKHKKISAICYDELKTQEYLKTHLLNNHETMLLFSLRSQNAKQFKANFPYNRDQMCPNVGCNQPDTQEHCLKCENMLGTYPVNRDIQYSDIYSSDINKQVAITKQISCLLKRREDASAETTGPRCCPVSEEENGQCSDQCLVI